MNPPLSYEELVRALATIAAHTRSLPDGSGVFEFTLSKSQYLRLRPKIERLRELLEDSTLTDSAIVGLTIEHLATELRRMEADPSHAN
jgi:hypothetical protein